MGAEGLSGRALIDVSTNRLACLVRHWTWADEAKTRFETELANGWDYDEDLLADHPFGAYYHWCALLCGLGEAALQHTLISRVRLNVIRADLETVLPRLQACRQLLVMIPESMEEHPRLVDVLEDTEVLGCLRRLHHAFGEMLNEEQVSRQREMLEPDND
jgi:hypothetical protein